ncbi:MAG: hypothetical protein OXR68_06425, partial [Alphaproteobacteria bacterium]|nr:hypothetical protein [Alphaproteobacteria bacterium]
MVRRTQKTLYAGRTVFVQLALLMSVFLALLIGSYLFMHWTLSQRGGQATLMNSLSLQRMLSERYMRHISIAISAHATQDWKTVMLHRKQSQKVEKLINTTFMGLIEGGDITLSIDGSKHVNERPISDSVTQAAIVEASDEWSRLKRLTRKILRSDVKSIVEDPRFLELEKQLQVTLEAVDSSVQVFQRYLEDGNREVVYKQEFVLILGITCFLITLLYAQFAV